MLIYLSAREVSLLPFFSLCGAASESPFQFVTQQRKHPVETSDSKYISFWTSRYHPQQPEAKLTDKLPSLRKGRLVNLIKTSYFNSHFTSDFPGDQKRVGLSGTSVLTRLQAQGCVLERQCSPHTLLCFCPHFVVGLFFL